MIDICLVKKTHDGFKMPLSPSDNRRASCTWAIWIDAGVIDPQLHSLTDQQVFTVADDGGNIAEYHHFMSWKSQYLFELFQQKTCTASYLPIVIRCFSFHCLFSFNLGAYTSK